MALIYLSVQRRSPTRPEAIPPTRQAAEIALRNESALVSSKPSSKPPGVREAPRLPQSQTLTHPEVHKLIDNDDVCGVQQAISEMGLSSNGELMDILLERLELTQLKAVIGSDGPLYKKQDAEAFTNPHVQFLEAAALGGFLWGPRNDPSKQDPVKGLELMTDLARKSPNNAAYALLKMALEAGINPEGAKTTIENMVSHGHRFETHIINYQRILHSHVWDSPTMFLVVSAATHQLPTVGFSEAIATFKGIAQEESQFKKLGDLMVAEGLASAKTFHSFGFEPSAYSYGNSLMGSPHPNFSDLSEAKDPRALEAAQEHYDLNLENCDRREFDAYFERNKNSF